MRTNVLKVRCSIFFEHFSIQRTPVLGLVRRLPPSLHIDPKNCGVTNQLSAPSVIIAAKRFLVRQTYSWLTLLIRLSQQKHLTIENVARNQEPNLRLYP